MILTKAFLNEQVQKRAIFESIDEQSLKIRDEYDVFISYSSNDKNFAILIYQLLEKHGYTAYIDLNDPILNPQKVSDKTAERLIDKMRKCKGLLYLYSRSSSVSKWCPWEVGIFSGIKNFRCANLPIINNKGENFRNQEYLELYPYIEFEKIQDKDMYDFWVCESEVIYTNLRDWLNGGQLRSH